MKIGIVGNGGIVHPAVQAMQKEGIAVSALWCRNEERGRPVADQYGIEKVYTDYAAFLADDSFDTVYVALVNSAHFEYAKQALLAGKHVIVEKPLTSSYEEAVELWDIASTTGKLLFEAVMLRYSANYTAIAKNLEKVGEISLILANYSQYSSRYDAYLSHTVLPAFDPKLSGGALYDINVYNVHFMTGLFGAPRSSLYMANKGFNGIDTSGVLLMDYGLFKAVCTGAKDSASPSGITIQGNLGTITIPERPGHVHNVTFTDRKTKETTILDVADEDPMRQEFARIRDVVDNNDRRTAEIWMNHSLQTMAVLDQARLDAGIVFGSDEEENETKENLMASMFAELRNRNKN